MDRINLPEKIETERLLLQRLRYEDAEEIFYGYASKPEATTFMSWPTHKSIEDTRTFLKYAIQSWQFGLDYSYSIRLRQANQFIGSFGVINELGKAQFGYIFSPRHWGNGYATEACRTLMNVLKDHKEFYRIGTFVDVDNTASMRVLLKSGLKEEARLKDWFRFINQGNRPKDCALFYLPLE
ncbi:GNAT family N-acetyltransferase [Chryseosolibacter indicus]|uniref:GNAT family N-acetyltransferase n=1 Tax=Chryseosolibacter indicus TaxID=2782351 RepID=A0ABS5VPA5_9BACT|nr:GNAT family N-acetyltransferase [Chryseosolibacter indicus]MBT1703262.1 GNAT family N-acetyltransferase [Chryseosolibacter indicus]